MKLNGLTIRQAQEKLETGEITSVDLTRACLDRIKAVDNKVKACLTVCEEEALVEAKKADARRAKGELGDLLGIPYIAKDNIMAKGVKMTAASKILENYIAPFDATIIKKLKEKGAVLLGKSNLDEFAHGASTENSAFGPTHNPWDLERVPGGSSGGSAAAVAADMCLFALGTDTGGSIRCPASFCGVAGLKPTYGLASRFGLIAMTSSTDVPGPIAKTVEDAKIVMDAISGIDKNDATTVNTKELSSEASELSSKRVLKGKKIGMPKEYFNEGLDEDVKKFVMKAVNEYEKQGAEIVNVSLPHNKYGVAVYYIITPSEISSNLARFDGIRYGFSDKESKKLIDVYKKSRGKGFGPEAKRRIMLGTYALSAGYFDAYYLKAQKVRTIIKEEFDRVLKEVDCIITPTSPHTAFKIGEQSSDPLKMYLEDVYVTGASLAGLPAISIPVGFSRGLPVGMQIIGKRFDENLLYGMGIAFQGATDYHKAKPELK
ncbi:Asp-tRNA(Asn)/Glu-tRNA(Gln) amidotransferase subunit GatA [Candidatus Parcubacteria bacterium]|nr:Asp-tRNA(Asn)/Glu-tRNA(Gln) amidotransferase subunit GatA [Candidatus Parcubacteria bacterium]